MPKIVRNRNGTYEYLIEREDGGRNTKATPSDVGPYESPDSLNVVYSDLGGVKTRNGSKVLNTAPIATAIIDGGISYNGSMIVGCAGSLYRLSGTTFVTIPSAQSVFTPGANLAFVKYQGLLMMSDGTNGPYKYAASDRFHKLGIAIPSAPTGVSAGAGSLSTGTYYYKVAYQNSQVVNGQIGSVSAAVVLASSASVTLSSLPTGQASHGVNARVIYRASTTTGTFKRVGIINDNITSIFTDTVANGSETTDAVTDGTAPTPWTTAIVHKDRVFFDDSSDRSILRWTEYTNPFISEALSFNALNESSGLNITKLMIQDDLVAAFMSDNETWLAALDDPSDDTQWTFIRSRSPYGIVGVNAADSVMNSALFVGKQHGRITGVHALSGIYVDQTSDGKLTTDSVAEKIETDLFSILPAYWDDIAMFTYQNRIYMAVTMSDSTYNENIFYFDTNRLGSEGQPGSWVLWDGIPCRNFWEHSGSLYAGSSNADGYVRQLELDAIYNDSGSAINSYHWTRLEGTAPDVENWTKDFRATRIWYGLPGNWFMNVSYRLDGDVGSGNATQISLNPGGGVWGTMAWGIDSWGGGRATNDTYVDLGIAQGERIQIKFDNQNTAGQSFEVYKHSIVFKPRGQRYGITG